jgi:hypothetical protein
MKTDLVEIFQTIRAALQPYAAMGFVNRVNSDLEYDLWSEKEQADQTFFFVSVSISKESVWYKTGFEHHLKSGEASLEIKQLDDLLMSQIEDTFAVGYKIFKEKEWV